MKKVVRRVFGGAYALIGASLVPLFVVDWRTDGFTPREVVYYVAMGLCVTCGFLSVWLGRRSERRRREAATSSSPPDPSGVSGRGGQG